jgi:uncharacterized membrane protein
MSVLKKIVLFYYEGFRQMTWGKGLWVIILLKLFIMFFVLKLFFFPNLLKQNYQTDKERGDHVIEHLTNIK